jgi:hypothetical protein
VGGHGGGAVLYHLASQLSVAASTLPRQDRVEKV